MHTLPNRWFDTSSNSPRELSRKEMQTMSSRQINTTQHAIQFTDQVQDEKNNNDATNDKDNNTDNDRLDLFPYETIHAFFVEARENIKIYSKLENESMLNKTRQLTLVSRLAIDGSSHVAIQEISENLMDVEINNEHHEKSDRLERKKKRCLTMMS